MRLWLEVTGELPARRSLISDPDLAADPVYGPFVRALDHPHATIFFDGTGQRDTMVDAINAAVVQGGDPATAMQQADQAEQASIDALRCRPGSAPAEAGAPRRPRPVTGAGPPS